MLKRKRIEEKDEIKPGKWAVVGGQEVSSWRLRVAKRVRRRESTEEGLERLRGPRERSVFKRSWEVIQGTMHQFNKAPVVAKSVDLAQT